MSSDLKLVLASKSKARQAMLKNAGLDFDIAPANIDEEAIIQRLTDQGVPIADIAATLANEKALSISKLHQDMLVIGSDQALEFEGEFITKADSEEAAIEKLKRLSGKTHSLISSVSVAKGGNVLWSHSDQASLSMHSLDDEFWDEYKDRASEALVNCVGAYEYEGAGAWLFSDVTGDYFTILGMPLLPLLSYLREEHGAQP